MTASGTLTYIANIRVPSEKAHVLQIFKSCAAFARHGLEVELVHPHRRRNPRMADVVDVFEYYGVARNFQLRPVRSLDLRFEIYPGKLQALVYALQSAAFAWPAVRSASRDTSHILYTRDLFVASALASSGRRFFLELHTMPVHGYGRHWLRAAGGRADGIIVTTKLLGNDVAALGPSSARIHVAPDGVDEDALTSRRDRREARLLLGLDVSQPIAAYVGHLYPWKGVGTVLHAARELRGVLFLIVGGTDTDLHRVRQQSNEEGLSNVRLEGYVAPGRVSTYLDAADVLLLPNSGRTRLSSKDTSPLKAFEYMAASRPIVASDLPSLREIFENEVNALLVPPDDAARLAQAIRRILDEPGLADNLARAARERVGDYTWDRRAAGIIEFVKRCSDVTSHGSSFTYRPGL